MSATVRYELVPNVSDSESSDSPPAYDQLAEENSKPQTPSSPAPPYPAPEGQACFKLPTYEAATTLPTYKDVEKTKENEERRRVINTLFNLSEDDEDNELYIDGLTVGNDCAFFIAFIMGFFFNWIGLFIGYFIMFNYAGRYGAQAGFGISLIKWLFYLRYSDCCKDYPIVEHEYIWWIMSFIGFLLLCKGTVGWMSIRKLQNMTPAEYQQSHQGTE